MNFDPERHTETEPVLQEQEKTGLEAFERPKTTDMNREEYNKDISVDPDIRGPETEKKYTEDIPRHDADSGEEHFPDKRSYVLGGKTYETDDNGTVYRVDGKYYANDRFVLDGKTYETDKRGNLIHKDEENDYIERRTEKKIDLPASDPDKAEVEESEKDVQGIKGGSYKELKKVSDSNKQEVHHMPAKSASFLNETDGPAIIMDSEDHKKTASYGPSLAAKLYREKQKELIIQGKFDDAVKMDIDDIRSKFGSKYDDAIAQMLSYIDKLKKEGLFDGTMGV